MIKNFIFDFGNVLLGWNEEKIVENYTKDKEEKEKLLKVIFKSKEWFMLDEGLIDYSTAIQIFKNKIPDSLKDKVEYIMNSWYTYMPINNQVVELIKELKEDKYKIYALSNTHIPVYEYVKNQEVGKYFDGFIISAVEKKMKPNKEIYDRLFEKFNLVPEECFFIDDSKANIEIGKELGMQGYVFDNIEGLNTELKNISKSEEV